MDDNKRRERGRDQQARETRTAALDVQRETRSSTDDPSRRVILVPEEEGGPRGARRTRRSLHRSQSSPHSEEATCRTGKGGAGSETAEDPDEAGGRDQVDTSAGKRSLG
jgi:hypothetical protein